MSSIEITVPLQGTSAAGRLRRGTLLTSGAVLTLGAAAIHLAGTPARLAESPLLGTGIAALGLAQLVLVVALGVRPARRVMLAGAVIDAGAVLLWAIGHTIGLPVGLALWRPEPLSVTDLVLPVLEVGAALLFSLAVRPAPRPRAPRAWLTALALLPVVLLTTILTVPGAIAAPDDTWLPAGGTVTPQAGGTTTLTYCSPGGIPRGMDVTEPAVSAARPSPAVLYIHGGGWFEGDRQPSSIGARFAGQDGALFVPLRDELRRRGFVVAAIDYGLIPLYPWPDQIEDAKCAVRFMRAEAHRLGIDPNRIGSWGSSAGGHLVAMLGTAGTAAGFDVGQYLDQSSRVQAVVDMFGPTDLNQMGDANWFGRLVMQIAFGRASIAEKAAASPANHVAPGDPPFLILHGTDDVLVPPHHSRDLAQRLKSAGVPATLVMVEHTGHSMNTPGQQPSSAEVTLCRKPMCVNLVRQHWSLRGVNLPAGRGERFGRLSREAMVTSRSPVVAAQGLDAVGHSGSGRGTRSARLPYGGGQRSEGDRALLCGRCQPSAPRMSSLPASGRAAG